MKYEYLKGSEKDFECAPAWATVAIKCDGFNNVDFASSLTTGARCYYADDHKESVIYSVYMWTIIAERLPITGQLWNGVGRPPVGCECEVKVGRGNYNLCRVVYSDASAGVAFVYIGGDDEKYCGTIDCVTAGAASGYFRPIRTQADKKRDFVIRAIGDWLHEHTVDPTPLNHAIAMYESIAAGKITGVKLED
jgi:hypothetical protein